MHLGPLHVRMQYAGRLLHALCAGIAFAEQAQQLCSRTKDVAIVTVLYVHMVLLSSSCVVCCSLYPASSRQHLVCLVCSNTNMDPCLVQEFTCTWRGLTCTTLNFLRACCLAICRSLQTPGCDTSTEVPNCLNHPFNSIQLAPEHCIVRTLHGRRSCCEISPPTRACTRSSLLADCRST